MLVVSRRQGESIVIGENIEISILESSDGLVKIGIEAPRSVRILRKELILEIGEENRSSSINLGDIIKRIKE